jgi:hypothetical protein
MEAVMAAERALGNEPADVSAQKIGYDIASTIRSRGICASSRSRGASTAPTA